MTPLIGAEYPKTLVPLIDAAGRNINIVMYDWRWYADDPGHSLQQLNAALVRAAKRGVLVRGVLQQGVPPNFLRTVGIKAKKLGSSRTLHAKMVIVDSQFLLVGSHNFTRNAFTSNIEFSSLIEGDFSQGRVADFFENLYNI